MSPSKSISINTTGLADNPTVVAWIDSHDLRRLVFDDAAIGVLDVDLSAGQEADVSVHAEIGADHRLHVDRPSEPRRMIMRLMRALPADPTSSRTCPTSRRWAPVTGARSGSEGARFAGFRTVFRRWAVIVDFLDFLRAAFFFAMRPRL